jgi:hypothetical protein
MDIFQRARRGPNLKAGDTVALLNRRHGLTFNVFRATVARRVEQYAVKTAPRHRPGRSWDQNIRLRTAPFYFDPKRNTSRIKNVHAVLDWVVLGKDF